MKARMRPGIVGLSLATGIALSGISPLEVFAQQPNAESYGQSNSQSKFCRQVKGENFARTELFFGLSKPNNGQVTNEEFQKFVDRVVTPLFPDGLTLITARGQFRNSSGEVIVERSRLLILLYPFSADSSDRVEQVRQAYKTAFQQESVLRVDEQSCVSF
ncbi:MAG: DUF3574 domain-containing protein [Leptolyngbyaceae cyanobacterium CSU_1_3]|nr:DUF3574 domain-containing protein [Leptolyngbyaceae cyanobacterium CSU_1_3]